MNGWMERSRPCFLIRFSVNSFGYLTQLVVISHEIDIALRPWLCHSASGSLTRISQSAMWLSQSSRGPLARHVATSLSNVVISLSMWLSRSVSVYPTRHAATSLNNVVISLGMWLSHSAGASFTRHVAILLSNAVVSPSL